MNRSVRWVVLLMWVLVPGSGTLRAGSSVDPRFRHAWGSNLGWIDFRPPAAGAIVGEFICSGYLYAANAGWIHLGDGSPADGIRYGNQSADDYGVNHDGRGNLRGYAWGANVGWIVFENDGAVRVDLLTGDLSGHAWGANIGWISLSNAHARVRVEHLAPCEDADANGLPDAWERDKAGGMGLLAADVDSDGDGLSDLQEYIADTHPLDGRDYLRLTGIQSFGSRYLVLTWASGPTRLYRLERTPALVGMGQWSRIPFGLLHPEADGASTHRVVDRKGEHEWYRVKAVLPLRPSGAR